MLPAIMNLIGYEMIFSAISMIIWLWETYFECAGYFYLAH